MTNAAEAWQWGYESVCFLAQYSSLYHWAGFDEARAKQWSKSIQYILAANLIQIWGGCNMVHSCILQTDQL